MNKLKVYIAGKVSQDSVFGRYDWRDEFCSELAKLSGFEIINLDPTKSSAGFTPNQNDVALIFGRDCFMIKSADLVIVNLTDDISVGGSQEMLLAKYYRKPLVGIAPKQGKFFKSKKEILGKVYENWVDPFVKVSCDVIVGDINGAAGFIKNFFSRQGRFVKDISIIDKTLKYYQEHHYKNDQFLYNL